MRYWGLLAVKLGLSGALLYYVWRATTLVLPVPGLMYRGRIFGYDLAWTLAAGVFFLLCCGALALILIDQRYRCRVCARRLRMPVTTGSWGQMLQLGRPRTEYICPYGHGTLGISELQICGLEAPDWKPHEDIWTELESLEESNK
jgi:hypothetical protein